MGFFFYIWTVFFAKRKVDILEWLVPDSKGLIPKFFLLCPDDSST